MHLNHFTAGMLIGAVALLLTKLRIPPEAFKDMRFDLDRFNVNSAALFPDIDGLCAHIQWVNSRLQDEN